MNTLQTSSCQEGEHRRRTRGASPRLEMCRVRLYVCLPYYSEMLVIITRILLYTLYGSDRYFVRPFYVVVSYRHRHVSGTD